MKEALRPQPVVSPLARAARGPDFLITDLMERAARDTPDRPAVIDVGRGGTAMLTYRELADRVERAAQGLMDVGVERGEPVCYQLPNWWEFVVISLALVRVGAVACPLMPIFRDREVRFMVDKSGSRVLILAERFRSFDYHAMLARIRPELPALEHVFTTGAQLPSRVRSVGQLFSALPDPRKLAARRPDPDEVTQLLFTSGTTGEPKGVLHTHQTLLRALEAHVGTLGLRSDDTVFVPSPLAHQTGFLYGMWLSVYLMATGLYLDRWDSAQAARVIEAHGARFVQASTPFLKDLVHQDRPPSSLRMFVATGASIPRALAAEARQALDCAVIGGWGTTESGLVTVGSPADPPEKLWQTDGRAIDGMRIRVVDAQGADVPPGTEGRFLVDTPAMFVGYLGHPDWYRAAFTPDGFFDTGDLAQLDLEGFMRITGRSKDVINRGGEKIPVVEVEEVLYRHPAVSEVAVVAMPDPRLGERSCAFVVARPAVKPPTLAELTEHLSQAGMSKTYWPERLEIVPALPRTPSGKIQKYRLRELVRDLMGQEEAGAPERSKQLG